MADIRIAKPAAGIGENIPSEPGARFVFEFPTTDATLLRDGDNLVINFPDGAQISLQDFYSEYDEENLPSFVMDDVEVAAQDFFTAMNEPDLMPAAGPGTGGDAANARYHAYDSMALAEGIDHLWQLDWGMNRAFDHEDEFNSWGRQDDLDGQNPPANTLARADIPAVDTPDRDAPSHDLPDLRPETPVDRPVYEPVYRPEPTPPADYNPPHEPVTPPYTPPVTPPVDNNPPYEPVVPPTTPVTPPTTTPETPPVTPPVTPPGENPGGNTPPPEPDSPEPTVEVDPQPEPTPPDPDDKDPEDPDNPDPKDPDPSDYPGKGDDSPFIPNMSGATVVTDEDSFIGRPGGPKVHKSHGHKNSVDDDGNVITRTFDVNLNGEGGTVELVYGGTKVVLDIVEGDKPSWSFKEGNENTTFNVNGVHINIVNVTPGKDASGHDIWNVHFTYELKEIKEHKQDEYNKDADGKTTDITQDETIFGNAIDITVTDNVPGKDGQPDVDHGKLTVEIHDSVPEIDAVIEENVVDGQKDGTVSNNSAVFFFGADDNGREDVDYGHDIQKIEAKIPGEGGTTQTVVWGMDDKGNPITDINSLKPDTPYTSVDGKLVVTIDKKNGKITFEYPDPKMDEDGNFLDKDGNKIADPREEMPIKVTIIDADGDPDDTVVNLAPPTVNNPTGHEPELPEKPNDPENPPADPDNPASPNFVPTTGKAHVVVDEGNLEGGNGIHADHHASGKGEFTVDIPIQEGGHITLAGKTIVDGKEVDVFLKATVTAGKDGATPEIRDFQIVDENGNLVTGDDGQPVGPAATFISNGVELSNFHLDPASGANGTWTVKYDYELTGNQHHDKNNVVDLGDDSSYTKDFSTDTVVFGKDAVKITVEDGTGDKASGIINVEVHDDVPVIDVRETADADKNSDTIRGDGKFSFGADIAHNEGDEGDAVETITLLVSKDGAGLTDTPVLGVKNPDGGYTFDLGESGVVNMVMGDEGNFTYTFQSSQALNGSRTETSKYDFNFKVTDNDGDSVNDEANCSVDVSPTHIHITPDPNPEPEIAHDIIVGSSPETIVETTQPHIRLAFLLDASGNGSVTKIDGINNTALANAGLSYDSKTGIWGTKEGNEIKFPEEGTEFQIGGKTFTAHVDHSWSYKNDAGEEVRCFFTHKDQGEAYQYPTLYNSLAKIGQYIKAAYADLEEGNQLDILLEGFDIKIESYATVTVGWDAEHGRYIEYTSCRAAGFTFDAEGKLTGNTTTSEGFTKPSSTPVTHRVYESDFDDGETVPGEYVAGGKCNNMNDFVDQLVGDFNSKVVYNVSSSWGYAWGGGNYYNYTATNYDNALQLAHGWFDKFDDDAQNHTFIISDGGASAHLKPITDNSVLNGLNIYFANDTNNTSYTGIDFSKVLKFSLDGGHTWQTATNGSWSDIDWQPGVTCAVVNVGEEGNFKQLAINELGLIMGIKQNDKGQTIATQIKYDSPGAFNANDDSSPFVMGYVPGENGEDGYYVPCVVDGKFYNDHEGTSDIVDTDSQDATKDTANNLDSLVPNSTISSIVIGNKNDQNAENLKNLASDSDHVHQIRGWEYIAGAFDKIIGETTSPGEDTLVGGKLDDVVFGDRLALPGEGENMTDVNTDALHALVEDTQNENGEWNLTPAELAQKLWDNAEDVAARVDKIDIEGGSDKLVGAEDNDALFGMKGNDLLLGDGTLQQAKSINVEKVQQMTVEELTAFEQEQQKYEGPRDGNDKLFGGQGNDVLLGGGGDDYLNGGDGKDILLGGTGNDILVGGTNAKTANLAFLVDTSTGNTDLAAIKEQLTELFKELHGKAEAGSGDFNIFLLGFHSYATNNISVNLNDENALQNLLTAVENLDKGLSNGSSYAQNFEDVHKVGSNHELAFNYANAWLQNQGEADGNKVFLLGGSDASAHIGIKISAGTLFNSFNNNYKQDGFVKLPDDYEFGQTYTIVNTNGEALYTIDKNGMLVVHKDHEINNKDAFYGPLVRVEGDPVGIVTSTSSKVYNEYHLIHETNHQVGYNDGKEPTLIVYNHPEHGWVLGTVSGYIDNSLKENDDYPNKADDDFETLSGNAQQIVSSSNNGMGKYEGVDVKDLDNMLDVDAILSDILPAGDKLLGGEDNDILFGDDLPDNLAGLSGADIAQKILDNPAELAKELDKQTEGDDDTLLGGEGNDILFGQAGNDILDGGAGNDMLFGGSGDDKLDGGAGDDYLDGGSGADEIMGGEGNDIIVYDSADKSIDGGDGIDIILAGKDDPQTLAELGKQNEQNEEENKPVVQNVEVMIRNGNGAATDLNISNLADVAAMGLVISGKEIFIDTTLWEPADGQQGGDKPTTSWTYKGEGKTGVTLEVAANVNVTNEIKGDGEDNKIDLSDDLHHGSHIAYGMGGDDLLFGSDGVDKLFGGEGNDYLDGREGADWIDGGEGNDIIKLNPDDFLVDGGSGIDFILADTSNGDKTPSLADLLNNTDQNGKPLDSSKPMVNDVEVLLSGGVAGIESLNDLVAKGIGVDENSNTLVLDASKWTKVETNKATESSSTTSQRPTYIYKNEEDNLTLETTLDEESLKYIDPEPTNLTSLSGGTDESLVDGLDTLDGLDGVPGNVAAMSAPKKMMARGPMKEVENSEDGGTAPNGTTPDAGAGSDVVTDEVVDAQDQNNEIVDGVTSDEDDTSDEAETTVAETEGENGDGEESGEEDEKTEDSSDKSSETDKTSGTEDPAGTEKDVPGDTTDDSQETGNKNLANNKTDEKNDDSGDETDDTTSVNVADNSDTGSNSTTTTSDLQKEVKAEESEARAEATPARAPAKAPSRAPEREDADDSRGNKDDSRGSEDDDTSSSSTTIRESAKADAVKPKTDDNDDSGSFTKTAASKPGTSSSDNTSDSRFEHTETISETISNTPSSLGSETSMDFDTVVTQTIISEGNV